MKARIIMLLSILGALTACINSSHNVSSTSNNKRLAIFQDGVVVNQAQGIWLSEEYGWLLNIDNKGIERWQYAQDYCYPSPQTPILLWVVSNIALLRGFHRIWPNLNI